MKNILFLIFLILSFSYSQTISVSYYGTSDYKIISSIANGSNIMIEESNGDLENIKNIIKQKKTILSVVQNDILSDLIGSKPSLKNKITILASLSSIGNCSCKKE